MFPLSQNFIPRYQGSTFYFLLFTLFISISSCSHKTKVSLIVHHGIIYTVDSGFHKTYAMAIKDGKIVETGPNEYINALYEADSTIDAKNQYIFPGFIDAHCHFTGFATDSWKCDLMGTNSFDEVLTKIIDYSKTAPATWIYGHGWDQNDWAVKDFPNKQLLDSLFPDRPVFLKRIDGHAALANQKAIEIAGINEKTTIRGGSIELKEGKLTGIFIDNAMDLIEKNIPPISDSLAKQYFVRLQHDCFEQGLTGVHDCGISEHTVQLVDEVQRQGLLKMKIFALLSDSTNYYERWIKKGPYKTDRLHVGGFKLYADGALGSRGACLLDDYTDKKDWKGFLLSDGSHFKEVAQKLINTDFQMCTHAIGDSGNRIILKTYANYLKGVNDKRWRIEHAQVVNENDFDFFKQFSIIPSVQPTHATSDMYWAGDRLGSKRIQNAYAYQKLLQENGWMPLGTDFPVEYISPFKTFYAAVIRQDGNAYPKNGFQTENALTREQAMRGMTIWAAKAAFEEKEKGNLEPGKSADFIMIDNDLMNCDPQKILKTKVLMTFINGERVY
jgi:predicted amidohydrolase YtcJ